MCSSVDTQITGKLKIAIALTAVTLVAEVAGGFWTNSLALLSDAAHVFLDLFALILSLAAVKLATLPASDRHTFGFHRSEVFASFINGLTVFLMALGILYEAWGRFAAPQAGFAGRGSLLERRDAHGRCLVSGKLLTQWAGG